MRNVSIPGLLRALLAVGLIILLSLPAAAGSAAGPITTPTSAIRFYQQSVNRGLCAQAYKLIGLGSPRPAMQPFLKECAATKHLAIDPIIDPGYRIQRLNAVYACLGVHLTASLRNGSVESSGGWYFLEKTPYLFWHILLARSRIVSGGKAAAPPQTTCDSAVPPYARPSSAQLLLGSAFLSPTTGWIAVGRSGAYVPNGGCGHGIGTNCDTAQTVIYRTTDAGAHWQQQLTLVTLPGPAVWMRFFNAQVGLVAATVGPTTPSSAYYSTRSVLLRTSDGGQHWIKLPLPQGYGVDTRSITFSDPQHGWLWFGGAAMGSEAVYMDHTADGGRRWARIACVTFSNPLPGYGCPLHSGIGLGGDKEFLTFRNAADGWLTVFSNTGIPQLLRSGDGGRHWSDQRVGLPPGVSLPGPPSTVYPEGSFLPPHLFGQTGILAESVIFSRVRSIASWSRLYLFLSQDAGASWRFYQRVPLPDLVTTRDEPSPVLLPTFLDSRHWLVVFGKTIWSTADAGQTWSHAAMHLPAGLQLASVAFTDPSHGWAGAGTPKQIEAVGGGTSLLRTSDAGRTWARIALP